MIDALLLGAAVGLGVAMPLGAIGVLIMRTAMTSGWRTGAAAGLGAAAVDLVYATVAVLAGTAVTAALEGHERTVRLVGALVLAAIAVRGLVGVVRARSGARGSAAGDAPAPVATPGAGPARTFARFVALTAVNPLTAVYFAVVAAGLADRLADTTDRVAFVAGIAAASAAWQLALAGLGALVGVRAGDRVRTALGLAGDVVVLALAVVLAVG